MPNIVSIISSIIRTTYESGVAPVLNNIRLTTDGGYRTTEDGNYRITE